MGFLAMASPNRAQAPHFSHFYNFALDEFQSKRGHLGKPLNAMNFDEFVKSVVSDENHINHHQISTVHKASSPSSSSSSSSPTPFNLIETLSRKAVEEVWRDVVGQDQSHVNGNESLVGRQSTLCGETTLEEFLIRNGAINTVRDVVNTHQIDPIVPIAGLQQMDWLQFQTASVQQQQQQQIEVLEHLPIPGPLFGNPVADIGYAENLPVPMPTVETAGSQAVSERKRRLPDEMMEKTIERRQKRMIKNRESAARSRAKKQAYTNQLERDVSLLKEVNATLEKQMELMRLPFDPTLRPKYQFRRSSSARF